MEWRGTAGDQHHQLREGPASPVSGREGETSHHLLEVSTISFHRTSQYAPLRLGSPKGSPKVLFT